MMIIQDRGESGDSMRTYMLPVKAVKLREALLLCARQRAKRMDARH